MTSQDDTIRAGERLQKDTMPPPLPADSQPPAATPVREPLPHNSESQGSSTSNALGQFVSDNPGPSLLIGAGLAWLFVNRERSKSRALHTRLRERASAGGERLSEARESTAERLSEARESTAQRLSKAQEATSERLGSAKQTVRSRYHTVRQDNPLALGACALAVGLAIGLTLPSTEREDELMGESRDSLMDQARLIVEEARAAAVATLRSGKENVKADLEQTKEDAKGAVKDSAQEAKRAAKEQYRDQRETS